tara:strand:- start:540 stop:767 length:228 start_codon:yes stop_codon:yes gene_type:complete
MKNTLTTEQKINEFIGKLVGNLLTKRASKVLAKTMQNDTQLKKHINDIEKHTDSLKDYLIKQVGKDKAEKMFNRR